MQALVLVGGEGTRLRPLTLTQPKPVLPLVDRPFLRYMVDWLARHGVSEVVMACASSAEPLREALGEGGGTGPAISYVEEPEPLGTAGPIRNAAELGVLEDRFLVLNGDLLTDLDLSALVRAHAERGGVATLALHPVDDPTSFGLVRRDAQGAVTEFLEKPEAAAIDTDEVNAGAYVLERRIVDEIPPGGAVSIEREVFPRLVGRGLYGLRLEGYWMDIGTPERYLQASWDILERRVETDVVTNGNGVHVAAGAAVDPSASVGPRAVVSEGSRVAAGATVAESVLLARCDLGADSAVRGAILGAGVLVGAGASLSPGSVIGEGARIDAGVALAPGSRIDPGEVVR